MSELSQKGRSDGRRRALEKQRRTNPGNERVLLALARECEQSRKVASALDVYGELVEIYRRHGHPNKALAILKRMVELAPASLPVYRLLAETLDSLQRQKEAWKAYQVAIALADRDGLTQLASALRKRAQELAVHSRLGRFADFEDDAAPTAIGHLVSDAEPFSLTSDADQDIAHPAYNGGSYVKVPIIMGTPLHAPAAHHEAFTESTQKSPPPRRPAESEETEPIPRALSEMLSAQ